MRTLIGENRVLLKTNAAGTIVIVSAHELRGVPFVVGAWCALCSVACTKAGPESGAGDAHSGTAGTENGGAESGGGGQYGGNAGTGSGGAGTGGTRPSPKDAAAEGDAATEPDARAGGRNFSSNRDAFFGKSRCAQANVQLCEDFESGTLDTAVWTVSGDKPVIDGLEAARGSHALHIVKNGNGQSYIRESKTFPELGNTYYGRAFVYFNTLPAAPMTYAHWTMVGAVGTNVSGEIRVSGQLQNGVNHFGVGTDNRTDPNGTGDWTNSDQDPNGKPVGVPQKQWACIEWMHKGDTNETRFWWDATEHLSLYTKPTTPHGGAPAEPYILPKFTSVWVGWQEYQDSTEKFEMWVDEIAIDKERIGCVL